MCLPLKTLKVIALIQVFFALVLVIVAFIGAYYVTSLLGKIDQQLKELGVAFISIKFLSRPFWTFAFGILIVALCGILGTVLKNKNYFLVIFNADNLCFFVIFTLIGVLAIIFGVVITEDQTCSPSDPQYTTVQDMYNHVQQNLCKNPCECYYAKDITPGVSKEVIVYSKTDKSKAIKAQDCSYFNRTLEMDAQAIYWMEQKFECFQVGVQNIQFKCLMTSILMLKINSTDQQYLDTHVINNGQLFQEAFFNIQDSIYNYGIYYGNDVYIYMLFGLSSRQLTQI